MRSRVLTRQPLRLVRHQSEHGDWELVRAAPHPEISEYVTEYQGYWEKWGSFRRRRELPTDQSVLIINLGTPCQVIDPRNPHEPTAYQCFVSGPWDTYALTELAAGWYGLQVNFTPAGAYKVFGVPARELSLRVLDLEDLFGRTTRRLVTRLGEARSWEDRFDVLEALLMERLAIGWDLSPRVEWALWRLDRAGGNITVAELAREIGCSRKHLYSLFRQQVGLSPKMLARIIRFNRALRLVERPPRQLLNWADVALTAGYYDQSHLIKDFQQFTGSSPTDYLRRLLPGGAGVSDD